MTEQTETSAARAPSRRWCSPPTEPVEPRLLAQLVELPVDAGRGAVRRARARVRGDRAAASCSRGSPAATASRPIPTSRRTSSASCSTASTRGCRRPALETLAIIAYKQPISRGQISAIRGVNVEATLHTLLQRGYVHEVGRDPGPGNAVLYGTTTLFLERLGLPSLDDLPSLGDFVPDASVVEALERGLHLQRRPRGVDDPRRRRSRRVTADPVTCAIPRANGSRRCCAAPASARAACARS